MPVNAGQPEQNRLGGYTLPASPRNKIVEVLLVFVDPKLFLNKIIDSVELGLVRKGLCFQVHFSQKEAADLHTRVIDQCAADFTGYVWHIEKII